jgi:hypothetical protein
MQPHPVLVGLVTAIASMVLCNPLPGQWIIGAEVGADRFWGGSREKAMPQRSFRPYRATTLGVNLEKKAGRFAAGVGLRYSSAGLALEGTDGLSAVKGVFEVYSISPELVYHIAHLGSGNRLLIHAGPLLEIWHVLDEGSETRVGVQGGFSLRVPLGGRIDGSLGAGAAVVPSPFAAGQLDLTFERQPLWRRRFAVGLAYRL